MEAIEIVRSEPQQIDVILSPVMDLATAQKRLTEFQSFVKGYMVENEDFGIIPGTPKPTLLKPGADKLCELYGLSDEYEIVVGYSQENWAMDPPLFDYTVRCTLKNKRNERLVSTGLGSCNSYEGKYRWRDQNRKCPSCGKETIFRSKKRPEDGDREPGWYCWSKKGGCGGQFDANNVQIIAQVQGRIANDDIATLKNTILKMAKKRAKVDATLSATRSSGIFTQDVEDFPEQVSSHAPGQSPGAKTTAAPPTPKPQHTTAAPASDGLHGGEEFGMIEKLSNEKLGGANKDKKFRVFTFNGKSVFCWDVNLHKFLVDHADQNIYAVLETKNNFTSLISCRADAPRDEQPESFSDVEPLPDQPF